MGLQLGGGSRAHHSISAGIPVRGGGKELWLLLRPGGSGLDSGLLGSWGGKGAVRVWCSEDDDDEEGLSPSSCSWEVKH